MCINYLKVLRNMVFSCHLFGLMWFYSFDLHIFTLYFSKLRVLLVVIHHFQEGSTPGQNVPLFPCVSISL